MDPLKDFGQWPILQFGLVALTFLGAAYAIYRGFRDKGRTAVPLPAEQQWFFDGPLAQALRYLRDISELLKLILAELRPMGEIMRNQVRIQEEQKRILEEQKRVLEESLRHNRGHK